MRGRFAPGKERICSIRSRACTTSPRLRAARRANNDFFTKTLGLRRIKKTVNFDAPNVYHLYYGDEIGTPGTVMTYFPFPGAQRGRHGTGEVGITGFAVPKGSLSYWKDRLAGLGVSGLEERNQFGEAQLVSRGRMATNSR
jgi:glyoxalase family protein